MLDLPGARTALRANTPTRLLELREQRWLDVKSEPYEPRNPRSVEELAKDVAGLANGGGGLLILGIRTRLVDGREVLDRIEPLDRAAVDVEQIGKLIRQRITPPPRAVAVEWSDDQQGACVVYIDVPAQEPECLFVVAAPVGKPGAQRTDTVAVPVREDDGTFWLPRTEIQRLLSAGVAASGRPTPKALAELIRDAVATAPTQTGQGAPHIGQGLPQHQREMHEAYRQLRSAGLGHPAGEAYTHGPAVLQDFTAALEGQPEWVLCLVHGRAPVAVAAPVWQAIREAGGTGAGGDPFAATGYPTVPEADQFTGQAPWTVPADTPGVDLDGGSWGAGRLSRSGDAGWRWEPVPRLTFQQTAASRYWTARMPRPQLSLRVLASLPWAGARNLEITQAQRQALEQALPFSDLAGAVTALSRRRGGDLPADRWTTGPHNNSSSAASYSSTQSVEGRPALTAAVMIALPHTQQLNVVTCADILIEDTAAWAAMLPDGADTRLDLDEVQVLLLAAWQTAADLLPRTITDPSRTRWADPPTFELRLTAEAPQGQPSPGLAALLDLDPLGPTDRALLPEMAITVTAPAVMKRHERNVLLRDALARMTSQFGYVGTAPLQQTHPSP
jgi:hypothetical protein